MSLKKALITEEFHPLLEKGLIEQGYSCDNHWDITTNGVLELIQDYDLIVINSKIIIDKKLLDKSVRLKVIIRMGSGLEIIDLKECENKGIKVISTPRGNANAVAEFVLGALLSGFRNLYRAQGQLMENIWEREENRGEELDGKTMAIIGCGNNGSQLVNILSGFNIKLLVYDIRDIQSSIFNKNTIQVENMDTIYKEADIVSYHIPLNETTRNLVNEAEINKFHKPIILINTSRGGICEMTAILNGLKEGKIKKAILDVYEKEPIMLIDSIINYVNANKLFLSPHIAGWTKESKKKMAELALLGLREVDFY